MNVCYMDMQYLHMQTTLHGGHSQDATGISQKQMTGSFQFT